MHNKLNKKEINTVFQQLNISPSSSKTNQQFEVWEVPPIRKGTKLFSKTE